MGNSDNVKNWRNRQKLELIKYKGGKCEICGYDKIQFLRAFVFHHRNPEEKEFGISAKIKSFDKIKAEVDKCDLLCCRCHAELHDRLDAEKRNERLKIVKNVKVVQIKTCDRCTCTFETWNKNKKYCSDECKGLSARKVERPLKDELQTLIKQHSYVSLGKMFGVSDNAVKKLAKAYGIPG